MFDGSIHEVTSGSVLVIVENYRKGKNVEESLSRENIPIPQLPENFIWMQVHGGSKIRNLLDAALKGYTEQGAVVWSGTGPAISKTISCAEILKRRHKPHQVTKICYRKVEEFWEPLLPELDPLVVTREEPTIHILLSSQPLDPHEPGYQAPGCSGILKSAQSGGGKKMGRNTRNKNPRVDLEQIEALGLRTRLTGAKNKGGDLKSQMKTSANGSKPPA